MLYNPHNDSASNTEFAGDAIINHNNKEFRETNHINEEQWINTLFLISDTQTWIDELPLNQRRVI